MRIMYTCMLEIYDEIPDEDVEEVLNIEEVTQGIRETIEEMLDNGSVIISQEHLYLESGDTSEKS